MICLMRCPVNKQTVRSILLAVLLILFLTALPACRSEKRRAESIDPLTNQTAYLASAQERAWSGNLHFGNFVVAAHDGLIANTYRQQVALFDFDNYTEKPVYPQSGSQFATAGDWIYFQSSQLSSSLRKIMTDGTNSVRIRQKPVHHLIVTDDRLYAIDATSGQVFSMNPDGSDEVVLFEGFAAELIYDGQFLFVCGSEDRTGLIQIDPETATSTRLLEHRVTSLNVCGDWLCYADPARDHAVFAYNPQQQKERQLIDLPVTRPFVIHDSFLYYLDTSRQNRLMQLSITDGQSDPDDSVCIIDDVVDVFVVLPDAAFYRRPSDVRIYRVPLSGGVPEPLP